MTTRINGNKIPDFIPPELRPYAVKSDKHSISFSETITSGTWIRFPNNKGLLIVHQMDMPSATAHLIEFTKDSIYGHYRYLTDEHGNYDSYVVPLNEADERLINLGSKISGKSLRPHKCDNCKAYWWYQIGKSAAGVES